MRKFFSKNIKEVYKQVTTITAEDIEQTRIFRENIYKVCNTIYKYLLPVVAGVFFLFIALLASLYKTKECFQYFQNIGLDRQLAHEVLNSILVGIHPLFFICLYLTILLFVTTALAKLFSMYSKI